MAIALVAVRVFQNFNASGYTQKGVTAYNAGNFAEARANFVKAVGTDSKDAIAYFYLGKIALGAKDSEGETLYPRANFKNVILYNEKSITSGLKDKNAGFYKQSINDLGFAYWMLKDYAKADQNFLAHIVVAPDESYSSRYLLALDYFSRFNKPAEALGILLPAISEKIATGTFRTANDFKIYTLEARLYAYFNDSANVEKYANLAIDSGGLGNKDLDIQIAHAVLAGVYARLGNIVAAESELKTAGDLAGSKKAYACSLASVYIMGKNYVKAMATAGIVPSANTYTYSICLRALADANLASGNKIQAKKYFEDYIKITDSLSEKNIFVVRGLEEAKKALTGI